MCIYNINSCTCTIVDSRTTPEDMEEYKTLQAIMQSTTAKYIVTPEEVKETDSRSIHVGNLNLLTTQEDLRAHFYCCGAIKSIQIPKDIKTAVPKGFCFVEFETKESVELALKMDWMELKQKMIRVTMKNSSRRPKPVKSVAPIPPPKVQQQPATHYQSWTAKPRPHQARTSKYSYVAPKATVNRYVPY